MSKEALASEINVVARLHGMFRLRSGQVSNEYFDKYRFESDPSILRRLARLMLERLPEGTEILAGLDLGGVPIATAMSLESGLPTVFVRKAAKDYGTCRAVEGGDVAGRKIVLIEDVITTGGAVVEAARLVRDAGADVVAVACAIWRGQGYPAIAALADLPILPVFTKAELHAEQDRSYQGS